MYGKAGLDRFKKAQTLEPFSVTANSTTKSAAQPALREPAHPTTVSIIQAQGSNPLNQYLNHQNTVKKTLTTDVAPAIVPTQQATQVGGGQSTWQPPDWTIEPRPGVYYLEVLKDGEVLDRINLDKRRHIFGRQFHACDFVLDHQSVSRQHAVVVPHKNGSIYVIDLGSAHGTFVANERLTKDCPVELEVGQSLRFAASTRTYVLRKNNAALFPPPTEPTEIDLPLPPDPSDEEAVLAYNTYINRALNGLTTPNKLSKSSGSSVMKDDNQLTERASKRIRRSRVAFKDQVGGELVEVVGFSDGADVETEPGPMGVKEGSLVGKYESLVQITVVPKGKEQNPVKQATVSQTGVTEKLQQVLNKVKAPTKSGGIYDDLYGEAFSVKVGSTWAYGSGGREASPSKSGGNTPGTESEKSESNSANKDNDDDDDLFG
ncbi:protein phosphatase 1 regulatory inhibitor subunit PPP1R8 [Sesamum alatum]|uniref:Protein phosphatase 1 regulatory inhibitor subunit PPP1R8 n=1 Tax=Sesamum alatum TaxID=300844 RepID=A0AAE2CYN4_9LAMI|nr:protein phosphatase 1 regulatory inhibitor subunit PPP1R8 [Sesamum alatum]